MPKGSPFITLSLAGAALMLLGIAIWAAIQEPWTQRCRLTDGTVLTLEATTYGRQHGYLRGGWWQKLLQPLLPKELQPHPIGGFRAGNELVFWIAASNRSQGKAQRVYDLPLQLPWIETRDERGDRIGPFYRLDRSFIEEVHMFWLEVFPRRGKTVRVRFYGSDLRTPVAEFAAPNPLPGPYPMWKPEPFPITKRSGDLAFNLTELTTDLTEKEFSASPVPAATPWARAGFRITQNGRPTWEWEPVAAVTSDATRNVAGSLEHSHRRLRKKNGNTLFYFPGGLSANESAWKLRVEFSRNPHARFAPDEAWTVRGLAVPKANTITRARRTATRQGVKLTLFGIAGPGKILWEGDPAYRRWWRPQVRVRVEPIRRGQRLTLRAVDDRGRRFAGFPAWNFWFPGKGYDLHFLLNVPPGARTLDLTFAVHQSRYAEFLAKPSRR